MLKLLGLLAVVSLYLAVADAQTMDDDLRLVALDAHNAIRSLVAYGQAKNKNGTKLPTATNMMKMTYSRMIESYAQELADSCVFEHNQVNGTSNNLWAAGDSASFMDPVEALNSSVYSWYAELATEGQNSLIMDGTNYNHFTQVVWANSVEIGCAVANCPTWSGEESDGYLWTYVVCNYSPAGNIDGESIYEAGSNQANCPDGSLQTFSGLCQDGRIPPIHD